MSNEVKFTHTPGRTVYAHGRNASNQIWNVTTSAFEAFAAANWTDYAISLTEQGTNSRYYTGNWSPSTSPAIYQLLFFEQVGASPASADDLHLANRPFDWSGTGEATAPSQANCDLFLINKAFGHLGITPLTSVSPLAPDNAEGRLATLIFADIRDSVLQQHPWNSATRRVTLDTALGNAPVWGFDNAFALPTDFIRFIQTDDLDDEFRLEYHPQTAKKVLVSSDSEVKLKYIFRLEDCDVMEPLLKEAIATRLAAELATKVNRSKDLRNQFMQEYGAKLNEARLQDARERPVERMMGTTWLESRLRNRGRHPKTLP